VRGACPAEYSTKTAFPHWKPAGSGAVFLRHSGSAGWSVERERQLREPPRQFGGEIDGTGKPLFRRLRHRLSEPIQNLPLAVREMALSLAPRTSILATVRCQTLRSCLFAIREGNVLSEMINALDRRAN